MITQTGLLKALGVTKGGSKNEVYKEYGGGARLAYFLDQSGLIKLKDSDFGGVLKNPVIFQVKGGNYYGYEALFLQEIVRSISKAYLKGKLSVRQHEIGKNAELLDDAFGMGIFSFFVLEKQSIQQGF